MAAEDPGAAAADAAAKEAAIEDASRVRADVRSFVMTHADHAWSGRAVARVFHGIGDVSGNDSVSLLFDTVLWWSQLRPCMEIVIMIGYKVTTIWPISIGQNHWFYFYKREA